MNNPFNSEVFDMQDIRGDQYAVFPPVQNLLRIEGLGYLALALCVYQALGYSWMQFASDSELEARMTLEIRQCELAAHLELKNWV